MARDLAFNLEVVIGPTKREADGLAMSSRNQLLTPHQRAAAPVLYRALTAARQAWKRGERNADSLRALMTDIIAAEALARIDYVSVTHPDTLETISGPVDRGLFSMAVFLGEVRLIDNLVVGE
jgi:pantoate--beta-alanine ligase